MSNNKEEVNPRSSPTSLSSTSSTSSFTPTSTTALSSTSSSSSFSSSLLSLVSSLPSKPLFPKWFLATCHFLSNCLIWPFIGGIMYGIGEVTAREVLARKFQLGVPPSITTTSTKASLPSSSSSLGRGMNPSSMQLTNTSTT